MEWVKLGEIAIIHDGKRVPLNNVQRLEKSNNPIYPYYGANGLVDYIDEYIFDEELPILCIAEDGGSWGFNEKCSYIIEEKCWVNNHAHVITVKDDYNLNYINYYLNYSDLNKYITGTTRGKLTQKELKNIDIPNVSLEIQNKIVFLLRKVEDLIQTRQDQVQALDELVESTFMQFINNNEVRNILLDDIFDFIDGDRGKNYPKKNDLLDEGYCLFLNAKNVTLNGFKFENLEFISKERDELLRKGKIERGDIILTTRGTVGNIAYYSDDINFDNIRINSGMVILRKKIDINPTYFQQIIRSTHILKSAISGSAQPQLPIMNLKNIKVPLIDIGKQNLFAAFVEKIEKQKQILNDSLDELKNLFDSLMQDAFDGSMSK